jgi:CBS domain-containing membrane protein
MSKLGQFWRRETFPSRIRILPLLWVLVLLGGLAWLDREPWHITEFLVPPFAATLSILLMLPKQPVAQPLPVILGSTLGAGLGTLVGLWGHGPLWAAGVALLTFWLLVRIGIYHPPGIALSMYPLLLRPGTWFPVVVLCFTGIAVLSSWQLSGRVAGWPPYPLSHSKV